jgi:RND family efflux transporter MFP subunit
MSRHEWSQDLMRAAALALTLALAGCGGREGAATAESHPEAGLMLGPSDVGQVVTVDLAEGVPVSGTLAPIADARLTSPFDDQLELVRVQEGQRVAKGEVLARFRPSALGPAAASAAAQRHMAEADLQRMKNLEAAGAISQRELDDAEATLKVAEANAAQADKRLGDATVRAPFAGVVAERSVRTGDRVAVGDPLFRIVNTAALEFEAR